MRTWCVELPSQDWWGSCWQKLVADLEAEIWSYSSTFVQTWIGIDKIDWRGLVSPLFKGRMPLPNQMNFEKFQTAFDPPPPHFWKIMLQIFLWWIWLHICTEVWGPDSMKCMHMPSSRWVLFWFFSIQLLKKHTLNPGFTLFVSISCSKSPV